MLFDNMNNIFILKVSTRSKYLNDFIRVRLNVVGVGLTSFVGLFLIYA